MSKSQYALYVAILLFVTNLTTASVVYGLLYSVPAAAQVSSAPAKGEPILPKPDLTIPPQIEQTSSWSPDPMRVIEPGSYYRPGIERAELHAKWKLRGIAMIGNEIIKVLKKNQDGTDSAEAEAKEVAIWVCFFADNPRYYRVGDRLEETHFTVTHIHFDNAQAYVEVEGDLGLREKLPLETR